MREPGFSLVEVVIAITIFSLIITSLFVLQGRLLNRTGDAFDAWKSMVYLKNFIVEADRKEFARSDGATHSKTIEPGPVRVTYALKKISENSALKDIGNSKLIQADATWDVIGAQRSERLVSISIAPSKQEEAE